MEERTRAYLRGRFGDHYRRADLTPPPDASEREWGYIPWTSSPGTTMVRHRSLLDLGSIEDFLARERPRHVYFSAGRYDDPSASSMGQKGWRSSDLVFDLDADHLPSVTPGEDTYAEMLASCKDALRKLLDFLETDFGFEQLTVVFSGGRGYHVHVRDEGIQHLDRESRREIVDYVRGIGLEFDALVEEEAVGGTAGRSSPAHKRTLTTEGGWSGRAHGHIMDTVEALLASDESAAIERLTEYDGIGDGKAAAALRAMRENTDQLRAGNIDIHPAFVSVANALVEEVVEGDNAPIDEPVTTDTNRLIRLPGSLHGGSGLAVRRIDRDELDAFDPLVDAVPETFVGHDITVEVTDGGQIELYGDSFTFAEGVHSVPEYLGVFLMARGRAEKGQE
ncbi:DNA primase small subunit PriS [Halapricum hydrolyticum]|uniref:DNA primase small subunit PriS n=1 Tax=Halapricum hydrolyticum TaxID=2979991 RepID=A0AAE3LIR9_9EURY|nr:DNA primase small subunit PriS [Halapricum hydrolyticum]MCU4719321.1 DNA primase small subunit PriS [Halapricum hydrolyticum]MCU4728234.1 DNA primase small subunit PriS [Halapricum hydrolyticum]